MAYVLILWIQELVDNSLSIGLVGGSENNDLEVCTHVFDKILGMKSEIDPDRVEFVLNLYLDEGVRRNFLIVGVDEGLVQIEYKSFALLVFVSFAQLQVVRSGIHLDLVYGVHHPADLKELLSEQLIEISLRVRLVQGFSHWLHEVFAQLSFLLSSALRFVQGLKVHCAFEPLDGWTLQVLVVLQPGRLRPGRGAMEEKRRVGEREEAELPGPGFAEGLFGVEIIHDKVVRSSQLDIFFNKMDKKEARKFEPSKECKVSARASLSLGLRHARLCLQAFDQIELHGLAQASQRVCQIAAILEKQKEAVIVRTKVQEHEQQREGRMGLTVKIITILRKVKK